MRCGATSVPMKRRLAALALVLACPMIAFGAGYRSATLSDDRSALIIATSDGTRFDAPKLAEQVEYQDARISADGKHVGWLALFPNCCTSYPVPLKLVVLDSARQARTFEGGGLALFAWCFMPGAASVSYRQGVLHGSDFRHFERRRISDGRLLAQYEYPHDEAGNARARKQAPSWVRCVPE